jgi:lipid-A-disaccharide synthase
MDIVILSNGPGEIITWVRPVVRQLREQQPEAKIRISVILSPCPHATGKETAIALSYPEVDRVLPPEHFWSFLLWGKLPENWQWHQRGAVLFLGGDQFFTVAIARRLNYRSVIYAEWDARWWRWIDKFGVMKPEAIAKIPPQYARKFSVVGDLMADLAQNSPIPHSPFPIPHEQEIIGMLPGSKPAKLAQGVPLTLAIAQRIQAARPQTRFVIPVAPTLELATLARFADAAENPLVAKLGGVGGRLVEGDRFLLTDGGVKVELWRQSPAYDLLSRCRLCLTTVGANTAELGSLAVPMVVLLPTQQLDAMRAWDGLPGLLANLPLAGSGFAKAINWLVLRRGRLFAWPNIWAGEEVVPELVGELEPEAIAQLVIDFLTHPQKLEIMRDRLLALRGEPGAAEKLARLVLSLL